MTTINKIHAIAKEMMEQWPATARVLHDPKLMTDAAIDREWRWLGSVKLYSRKTAGRHVRCFMPLFRSINFRIDRLLEEMIHRQHLPAAVRRDLDASLSLRSANGQDVFRGGSAAFAAEFVGANQN